MRKHKAFPVTQFLLILVAVLLLLPIAATLILSFFSPEELKAYLATRNSFSGDRMMEIRLIPREFSLLQYYRILITDQTILRGFVNSALYAIAIIGGQILILPMLAYGLSCFRFRGRDIIAFSIVLLMVLPFQVTMVPNVLTLRTLNLLNSRWAVILPMLTAPFSAFLLRQYMLSIPGELIEAAQIDSAGPLHCYIRIVLPLSRPVIGTMIALSFAECWNLVEQPLVYLTLRPDLQPLSVTFGQLTSQIRGIEFAGAALFILPSLFVYMIFQDDIMEGVQIIGIK
jgi:multiple sugar transport system permease protein